MTLIVHPHFHRRRTGVTRHVEDIVIGLQPEAVATGNSLSPSVPKASMLSLWARMRREPTIWHAHRLNELYLGLFFRLLLPDTVKVVFTRHAGARPSRWTRFWARMADRVIALTSEARGTLALDEARIIGHGVDLAVFTPPRSRVEMWSALNLGAQRGIGVIGRIRPAKGQGDFVEAIAPLLERFPQWKAVLIGRGDDWAERLKAKTAGALALVDEQENIRPWYQGLSVLVHPSHSEGFSLVLLEAMASGCCVIATRLASVPDVITHEKTGLLYEPGDVGALRALLERVLANPDEAAALGDAARTEVVARFGLAHETQSLRALYGELTNTKR